MSKNYEIGYKKPPVKNRFRPGTSGNPRGRAPGVPNLKTDLQRELSERIPIREGDRSFRVSKQRALLKSILAKALKGDVKAANVILQLVAKMITPADETATPLEAVSDSELAIVENFIARHSGAEDPSVEDA